MSYQVEDLLEKLPPYKGRQQMLKARQRTTDIIKAIMSLHPRMIHHYDTIARDFWRGNIEDTARGLYAFAKNNLPYREEKTMMQTVKTPAAILQERLEFGNDCKHYASIIVGIGEAMRRLGYPVKCFYRFATYRRGQRSPGHVFAVFVDNGREIWVDPVPQIRGFNSRDIRPVFKIDKMPPMSKNGSSIGSLYEISGVPVPDDVTLGGLAYDQTLGHCRGGHWTDMYGRREHHMHPQSRIYHFRGQDPHTQSMPAVQHWLNGGTVGKAHKKHHHHLKIKIPKIQPGKLFKMAMGAPSRNAFLLLVKLNTFHMAINMWKKAAHDKSSTAWKKLAAGWAKVGGKPEKLYKEIVRGVKTYNKLHKAKKHIAVAGFDDMMSMNGYTNTEIIEGVDDEDVSDNIHAMPDFMGAPYHDDMQYPAIFEMVGNNHEMRLRRIGVVQAVAGAAIIAAAAPIMAALAGLLKSLGIHSKKAEDTANQASDEMAAKHNENADQKADENGDVHHEDGSVTHVTDNPDGTQTMTVKKVPGLNDQEQDQADGDPGDGGKVTKTKKKEVADGGDGGDGGSFLDTVKNFVSEHKMPLILTAAGTGALIFSLAHKPGRGGSKAIGPIVGIAGAGLIVWGGIQLFKK